MHPIARASLIVILACLLAVAYARFEKNPLALPLLLEALGVDPPPAAAGGERPELRLPDNPKLRVLMIGNSHSAPIPALLNHMAAATGVSLRVEGITPGGRKLAEHVEDPRTATVLRAHAYDIVTIQEQGQVPAWSEELRAMHMYPAGEKLAVLIRATGAEPWIYSVYARPTGDAENMPDKSDTYEAMQDRSIQGYAELAARTHAKVVPVGAAFRAVHALKPNFPLWKPDGIHASDEGFYLAAAVFYATLLGRDPTPIPFDAGLRADDAAFLRRMAASTSH